MASGACSLGRLEASILSVDSSDQHLRHTRRFKIGVDGHQARHRIHRCHENIVALAPFAIPRPCKLGRSVIRWKHTASLDIPLRKSRRWSLCECGRWRRSRYPSCTLVASNVSKLATYLVHNGANGDAKTAWSFCVLDICIRYNWAMMASFLLELEEQSIGQELGIGSTVLHQAASLQRYENRCCDTGYYLELRRPRCKEPCWHNGLECAQGERSRAYLLKFSLCSEVRKAEGVQLISCWGFITCM